MTKKHSMMDEHLMHLGWVSTARTSSARTWIYTRNHFEKNMVMRTTWWPRTFTNMEEKSTLGERRTCEAPFGNNMCAHSSWGGDERAMCRQGHALAQDGAYGGQGWKPGTRITVRGTWKTMRELELLYMGGRSSTLLVMNIGRTSLPSPDSNHNDTLL